MAWSTVDNQTLRMWIVSSSCTKLHGQTTDGNYVVGLAMLNGEPVTVDILDAKSALDSDANFTGVKKRVSKVCVPMSMSYDSLMSVAATVTDQCRASRRNLLYRP